MDEAEGGALAPARHPLRERVQVARRGVRGQTDAPLREIVPEFVPHLGGASPIITQASKYLLDSKNSAIQAEELGRVISRFANKKPAEEATRLILQVLKDGVMTETPKSPQPKVNPNAW